MRNLLLGFAALAVAGSILSGCSGAEVSSQQQQSKAKFFDDIQKQDPDYAKHEAEARQRG